MQLRYLQTLTEIAVEKNSTIIFPLPMDLVQPLMNMMKREAEPQQVILDGPHVPQKNGQLSQSPQ
jgi:hypothetical protein